MSDGDFTSKSRSDLNRRARQSQAQSHSRGVGSLGAPLNSLTNRLKTADQDGDDDVHLPLATAALASNANYSGSDSTTHHRFHELDLD